MLPKIIIGAVIIFLIAGVVVAKNPLFKETLSQNLSPQIAVDPATEKKQALEKFYAEISEAQDNQDWSKIYDLAPQSVKKNVTKEQFIADSNDFFKKDGATSIQTTVNSIQVNGDIGIVDRTVVSCYDQVYSLSQKKLIDTPDCTGEGRKEANAKKEYEYVNGKWQIPDLEPSERALKAANYGYENSSKNDQKDLRKSYSYGSDSPTFTVRNWAIYLDKNLEELIRVETLVEQDKSEKSRPVYYQQPAQIIQQQAPQQNNSFRCTSSTIGNYTNTNCY